MVEIDGEKLMVSSSNFDDGSMIVSVGTTDFNNYGDSDFMEIMINKEGKIDYLTLPVGKDDYQRMYKIKPSHYGRMKTQNETNESAGGDFIRIDGDGKYAESFGAEGQPIYERKYRQIVVDDKLKNKLQMLESIIKSLNEAIQGGRFDVVETEVLSRAVSEVYFARDILMGGYWEAESFGAEMKLPKLTKTQMDFLKYKTRWFMAYSAYARGQSDRYWSPEDWKDGKAEQCFTITSDGWGNDNIARRTLKSLLEKKVLYATKTNYFDYDGRIRKSPAQQVNENPDLVSKLTSVCLGLTPIGVEIIKREFARQVKDVVGWRIELTLEDGQTAYLSDMPDDIAQSIDNHIEEVKWDMGGEQFGAETFNERCEDPHDTGCRNRDYATRLFGPCHDCLEEMNVGQYDKRFERDGKSFGAELLGYPHPMSDRQKYRIRKLGGRIDKSMSRSQASQYIKSLMRIDPLHAESTDCSACQGWGWNEDLNMVCDADGCIGGWIVPKKPSLLERGLELGAGVGMGVAGVAILFGVLGGTVGFAAEEMKKRRD